MAIPPAVREAVIERAQRVCEYCQTAQAIVIEMQIDHIHPASAGGTDDAGNLCLACASCNSRKQDAQTGKDPQTGADAPLFNPRQHQWADHFQWSADGTQVIGRTSVGRATVARLKMNRDLVVRARALWVQAGWHPPRLLPRFNA